MYSLNTQNIVLSEEDRYTDKSNNEHKHKTTGQKDTDGVRCKDHEKNFQYTTPATIANSTRIITANISLFVIILRNKKKHPMVNSVAATNSI